MRYMMTVKDLGSGEEHELPADTVTRDAHAPGQSCAGRVPLLPLGFRPREAVFFVHSDRFPNLRGKWLQVCGARFVLHRRVAQCLMQVPASSDRAWTEVVSERRRPGLSFLAAKLLIAGRWRPRLPSDPSAALVSKASAELHALFAANATCPSVQRDLHAIFSFYSHFN